MIRLLLLLAATASTLHAVPVTLNFSAQGSGGGLGKSNGQELPIGSLVLVGTPDLTPEQVVASGSDHFTLLSSFRTLGSTVIGHFNGVPQNASGAFSASTTVDSATTAGKRIYLWAFDAPTIGQATSQIMLSSASWVVPSFGSINCETSQIPFANSTTVAITTRQASVTSATLGGILNQALPLAHPDNSDNDHDGIPALMEWATGGSPSGSNPSPLVFQNGSLSFPRRPGTSGSSTDFSNSAIRYHLESSANLKTWSNFEPSSVSSSSSVAHPALSGMELLTLNPAPDNSPARFWRLCVTRK